MGALLGEGKTSGSDQCQDRNRYDGKVFQTALAGRARTGAQRGLVLCTEQEPWLDLQGHSAGTATGPDVGASGPVAPLNEVKC
jgi:hypothetical protein